jgi:hypothetical protein
MWEGVFLLPNPLSDRDKGSFANAGKLLTRRRPVTIALLDLFERAVSEEMPPGSGSAVHDETGVVINSGFRQQPLAGRKRMR